MGVVLFLTSIAAGILGLSLLALVASQSWNQPNATDCLAERLSCIARDQQRCECTSNCHYFGSCCAIERQYNRSAIGSARAVEVASRLLPEDLYECVATRYGLNATYIISKCPGNTTVPKKLVELCNMTLKPNQYFDARFWPVTSSASQLVYQSKYCALCHGEATRSVVRWTAYLNCSSETNTSDVDQVLRRCKVQYSPPTGLSPPPRCRQNFVGYCQLSHSGTVDSGGDAPGTSAVSGTVASGPSPQQQRLAVAQETFDACRREPQAVVWWGTTPYRNNYCAACSGLPLNKLACSEPMTGATGRPAPDLSFRVLLDPAGPLCSSCSPKNSAQASLCDGTESVYDWSTRRCQPFCPPGTLLLPDGGCEELMPQPPPPLIAVISTAKPSPANSTKRATTPSFNSSRCVWTSYAAAASALNESDASQSGVAANVSIVGGGGRSVASAALYASSFPSNTSTNSRARITLCAPCRWHELPAQSFIGNLTIGVHWRERGRTFRRPLVRQLQTTFAVCLDLADDLESAETANDEGSCGRVFDALGVALMAASLVCLAAHAVAFFLVSSLRNMPGRLVFSQVVALLFSYGLFLLRVPAAESEAACYAVAAAVHYFLLAYFAWTLVLAIEIHGAVRALKRVYSDMRQFVAYSIAGWLSPLAVVAAAALTDRYGAEAYRPRYGGAQCWMGNTHGFRLFFIVPMCAVVFADIALYSVILVRIVIIARQTAQARSTLREKAVLCAKLLFALGVLWLFAVVGALSENSAILCLFANVLNTSQGVVVFAVFLSANKGARELLRCCAGRLQKLSDHLVSRSSSRAAGSTTLSMRLSSNGSGRRPASGISASSSPLMRPQLPSSSLALSTGGGDLPKTAELLASD